MLTRQKLIQYGIRLGAMLSTPFVPAIAQVSARPRMPVEEFSKDAKLVASLRRAVTVMKARPPSDPTSWFFQAAVHAVRNNEIVRVSQQDPGMANVDVDRFWNRCPHFGENAANFPLWHRAYVYYFERILRDAAQDSELSLPYWNYTELAGAGTQNSRRLIPSIFQNPQISGPGSTPNSLHHEWRDFDAGRGISELSFRAVDTTAALASPVFFGGTEFGRLCRRCCRNRS